MEKNLTELARKYGTDKLDHNYIQFYEWTMLRSPKRILEIGVKEGRSIRMWQEFLPNAEIHGLDLFEEFPIPDIPGAIFHKGNQCDWRLLEQLRKFEFDAIIDDGSHNSRDQMMSFYGLFHPKCQYYIEDLQCCDEEFYRQGLPIKLTAKHFYPHAAWYDKLSPIVLIEHYVN